MDTLSFAEVGEQLVRDLNEVVPAPRSKRWRCPAELKTRVVSYARACREQGETIEGIAFRLGLLGATLARWLRSDQEEVAAGFRSVAIVASAEDDEAAGAAGPLRLVTPRGYRVEGLDPQTLAYLLRVVG